MVKTNNANGTLKLIDTDIFIDFLRGTPNAHSFMEKYADTIIFSAITEAELLSGKICSDYRERENVLHLLSLFEKIPVGNPLVIVAGDIRRMYTLDMPDAIIAASAITQNAVLITKNIKDFERVKELNVQKPY